VLLYWQLLYQPSQNYLLLTKNYGRIEIIEDSYGIPHISSETQEGTMFGMGLEHAKNRLFQMHIKRRCVSGRFSEVFGSKTISMDIQFLEFQLYEQSKL
jgi:penicillin amidase